MHQHLRFQFHHPCSILHHHRRQAQLEHIQSPTCHQPVNQSFQQLNSSLFKQPRHFLSTNASLRELGAEGGSKQETQMDLGVSQNGGSFVSCALARSQVKRQHENHAHVKHLARGPLHYPDLSIPLTFRNFRVLEKTILWRVPSCDTSFPHER